MKTKLKLQTPIPFGTILRSARRESDYKKNRTPALYLGIVRSVGGKTANGKPLHILKPGIRGLRDELLRIEEVPVRLTAVTEHTICYDYDSRQFTGEDTLLPRSTWVK